MEGQSAVRWVSIATYLLGGTALTAKAMNATDGGTALLLVIGAMTLLFLAALANPRWWMMALPLATIVPVAAWAEAECEPNFLDLCGLVWPAALVVAVVIGVPVALLGVLVGRFAQRHSV